MYLTKGSMAALLPTLSTAPNPQVWYMASAGFAESTQLAELRNRALDGDDQSLAYFEWSAPDDAKLDDRDAWYQANPALGIRITEDYVAAERAALSDEDFGRERLGLWNVNTHKQVINAERWRAAADDKSVVLDPVALAVDVSPTQTSASVAAAGARVDEAVHVELVDYRNGTAWIVKRVTELVDQHNVSMVVIDPAGPAGSLIPEFLEHGIEVRTIKARDLGQACGAFYDLTEQGRLVHLDQPQLNDAVAGAKRRPLGDMWAWHRKDVTVDITPLVAVTLAAWGWQQSKLADPDGEVPDLW